MNAHYIPASMHYFSHQPFPQTSLGEDVISLDNIDGVDGYERIERGGTDAE